MNEKREGGREREREREAESEDKRSLSLKIHHPEDERETIFTMEINSLKK